MPLRFPYHRHAIVAAALLAVGVGAATAAFTVLRALSAAGLPYPHADRLVVARVGGPSWSPAMFEALTASTTTFERVTGIQERAATLSGASAAEIVRLESVSAAYFEMFDARPVLGRVFSEDEDRRNGSAAVAVISDGLWRRRFGGDPGVLDRHIDVDGRALAIIGVLPRGFGGVIGRTDLWAPLGSARWLAGDAGPERPSSRWFEVIGRRRADVSAASAEARFAGETRAAIAMIPGADRLITAETRLTLTSFADARVPAIFPRAARVVAIAATVLLALVIVNVISLHSVRLDERRAELAVRLALGASLGQIARPALLEAGVVALTSTAGALVVRPLFLAALSAIQPPSTSFGIVTSTFLTTGAVGLDALTIAVAIAVAIFGSLPLAIGTVISARHVPVESTLRGGAGGNVAGSGRRLATVMVTVQAALACAAVGGGALLARSASELFGRDRGYQHAGVMTAQITVPDGRDAPAFYDRLAQTIAARPGIASASVANCAPGGGRCRRTNVSAVDGTPIAAASHPAIGVHYVTPRHFATIGARLVRGREIVDTDRPGAPLVAVISAPLAAMLWPGQDPLGRTLEMFTANGSLNGARVVVGTIAPIAFNLDADPGLDVFLPAAQAAWTSGVVFASGSLPLSELARTIVDSVAAVDRAVPVFDVVALEAPLERSLAVESFLRQMLLGFGVMGLLLAASGTYSVVARFVAQTRREIGIRIALGASPRRIGGFVLRRGLAIAVLGAAVGTLAVAWWGNLLTVFLHGLSARDPIALAAGPAVTAAVILLSSASPALRAARFNATALTK